MGSLSAARQVFDHELLIQRKSSFVIRLQDNTSYEIMEEHQLSDSGREAGVEFDRTVRLGCKQKRDILSMPIRIIQVHYFDERVLSGDFSPLKVSWEWYAFISPSHLHISIHLYFHYQLVQ
ncbi:MAG: hypothetical protein ACE5GV_16400 [Candidatus Scalindua sp.]